MFAVFLAVAISFTVKKIRGNGPCAGNKNHPVVFAPVFVFMLPDADIHHSPDC